jgi:hypothetical protein
MRKYLAVVVSLIVGLATSSSSAWAQAPNVSANDLVRRVIQNEDRANSNGTHYMYRLRSEKPERTVVKELVETNDGMVARLLSVNDQPPTADQRANDEKKLDRLVRDPAAQKERTDEQKKDEQRTRMMVKTLPDAFLYQYDGEEVANGAQCLRLRFGPNPNFDPPSRETMAYRGMQGYMLIEPKQERLVRIDAQLFQDVTFGWGILGRLNKGGHFLVEQSSLGEGRWETTRMELDFFGKALLFKTIRIKETEVASAFRKVPPNLTLAQGVDLLRKSNQVMAEGSANRGR